MQSKKLVGLSLVLVGGLAGAWFFLASAQQNENSSTQQGDKLKGAQEEIASLTDEELAREVQELEGLMRRGNLLGRLNGDLATKQEKELANATLLRLALLNVERSKRTRAQAVP